MAAEGGLAAELQAHLARLQEDPTMPLDEKLFESSRTFIAPNISPGDSKLLVQQLALLVVTLQQDPKPINDLLLKLLEPYSFSDILSLNSAVDFVAGLDVDALSFNLLTLSILEKATCSNSDAAILATKPEIVYALVRLWLSTPETGVADKAENVLLKLLKTDHQISGDDEIPSTDSVKTTQGLIWRRIFGDKDVYALFFAACSLTKTNADLQLTKRQKTLAQARLLEWLPQVAALGWEAVISNHHPDIEASYGLKSTDKGLLHFAACCMVDYKEDVLMHMSLLNFCSDLLRLAKKASLKGQDQTVALEFLITTGLHARSLAFFLQPNHPSHDPIDVSFLYGVSANYTSVYASTLPEHFLKSSTLSTCLLRLSNTLNISASKWVHGESPKHDLHVLASMPRRALFPRNTGPYAWHTSPLSLIPSDPSNADALNTLATIFHGPTKRRAVHFPPDSPLIDELDPRTENEAAAARALFYLYFSHRPNLFSDIVSHAETIAIKEKALAAINFIASIATAEWAQDSDGGDSIPTDSELASMMPQPSLATTNTGALAILTPPSLEYTLPYLLKPAQSFTNLVGGRGDTESAAYTVAMEKFDALKALQSSLRSLVEKENVPEYSEILGVIDKRVGEGPWSREGEIGGRIGTLEL
ncbi:MAG: hypothetical protein M1820_005546 [Bogoriella megaspora]|nr:MAG: hypothetical protein M1820_005546 [Bogoriella megaspora]